jgi:hypothetical protein
LRKGGTAPISPVGTAVFPQRTRPYKAAPHLPRRAGRTLHYGKGNHLQFTRRTFGNNGGFIFPDFRGNGLIRRRNGRWNASRFFNGNRFGGRLPFRVSVFSGDDDLRLSLFYRLLRWNGGCRRGFLFYNDHLFDRVGGRNRFSPLGLPIVSLPFNEFYFGFLNVI